MATTPTSSHSGQDPSVCEEPQDSTARRNSASAGDPQREQRKCQCQCHVPKHVPRTLILCFDGTGDQFDEDNSNIVEFFNLLKKDERDKQLVYYQAGIGTYTAPHFASKLTASISKVMDEAIAWNLRSHVMRKCKMTRLRVRKTSDDSK